MEKTNKELAVELACASLIAMSHMNTQKPLSNTDIKNVLNDCYTLVSNLPKDSEISPEDGI